MAMVNVDLSIRGHKQISDALYSEEFDIRKKLEWEAIISSTDGYISIPISNLSPINKIIAYSDNSYKIKVIDSSSGVAESYLSGICYLNIDPAYSSNITNIYVGTDSTTGITTKLSIVTV